MAWTTMVLEREWQGHWLDRIKRICYWTGYGVCDKERGQEQLQSF